nr:MAG TPA: hypothetical protein [Caudoviricetes sp.]
MYNLLPTTTALDAYKPVIPGFHSEYELFAIL